MVDNKGAKESPKEKITKLIDISYTDLISIKIMAEQNGRTVKRQIERMIHQQVENWDKSNNNYPTEIVTNEYESEELERLHKIANVKWIK